MSRTRAEQVLSDSLRLQRSARAQQMPRGRGRRRKGDVIDLDRRTVARYRRHRAFMALLVLEALIAVVAVAVFAYVVATGRGT